MRSDDTDCTEIRNCEFKITSVAPGSVVDGEKRFEDIHALRCNNIFTPLRKLLHGFEHRLNQVPVAFSFW